MITELVLAFTLFHKSGKAILKDIDNTLIKINVACHDNNLGPSECLEAIDDITDLRFRAAIQKTMNQDEVVIKLKEIKKRYRIK